jgi:hypothetical protein
MRGAIPPHHQYVFMAWCLVKHRDNFTFLPFTLSSATGNSSLSHRVQTGSGTHPASYKMGPGGSFSQGKVAGVMKLTTHLYLVPTSRIRGAIPPLTHKSSWRGT